MAEHDTITASGQTIHISDGETWSNKLIDLGNGNDITIVATGTNWTIRDVGFTGTWHHTTHEYLMAIADTGGNTSTIENVYFEDGDPNASSNERGGCMWADPSHSGRLEITNVNYNIEGAIGIYGSAPGSNSNGQRGTIHLNGCYAIDNHHTGYRISDNGDSIHNSSIETTGSQAAARAIWVWEGTRKGATIENVNFDLRGSTADIATNGDPVISTSSLDYGTAPVPDGCPTSATQAAEGSSGSGPDDPAPEPDDLAVSTGDARSVTSSSATLTGEITGMGDNDDVDVYFEYRETGPSSQPPEDS